MSINNSKDKEKKELKNILVVGSVGVGKSSIIKLITNDDSIKVSNRAQSVTQEYNQYIFNDWCFVDTIGLHQPIGTKEDLEESANKLNKFIQSYSNTPFSLILFVIEQGRITEIEQDNYKLFVEGICQKQIPVILAITHCELEEPMDSWWIKSKPVLEEKYKWIDINEAVSVCSISNDELKMVDRDKLVKFLVERQQQSRVKLIDTLTRILSSPESNNKQNQCILGQSNKFYEKQILAEWILTNLGLASNLKKHRIPQINSPITNNNTKCNIC